MENIKYRKVPNSNIELASHYPDTSVIIEFCQKKADNGLIAIRVLKQRLARA